MRIWIDTEFNGFGGELISVGLVAADGREFYEVLGCCAPVPWVQEHVMPFLVQDQVTRRTLQNKLQKWLHCYDSIELVADWPTDIEHFCSLLIIGPGQYLLIPPLTIELITHLANTASTSELPHNALADAKALRDMEMAYVPPAP